jgi:hypothetical protein
MSTRAWILLGIAAAAAAVLLYSLTGAGSAAVGGIVGNVISTIRGIRNNNPTNLEDAGIAWQGLIGVDGVYLKFDTLHNGLRAASLNLKNYALLHGINTVDAAIRRWSSTDQDAYVTLVSSLLQVDPHESIDLTDAVTRQNFIRAMIIDEDTRAGSLLISDDQIAQAVADG